MSNIPADLRYTREHEWARLVEGGRIVVGITDFAQEQLGDIVYLDLPETGTVVAGGEPFGEIESTKSVSDLFAPVGGAVAEVNAECRENPAAVNQDPYGEGWLIVIELRDQGEFDALLSPDEYEAVVRQAAAGAP